MTYPFRCVVFAAVSSRPQAADDKDSIPSQIERARNVIEQRGWKETHEPLIVPGQSRNIDFLHEAIEEIPPIADLVNLARHGGIDLVVIRDYDRLARTRALLTQLTTYLSRCRVQSYALDKPVEPVHPDELGRRLPGPEAQAHGRRPDDLVLPP
jgi:DNA invertase Pin-like site-specific DNA recombinase